MRLLPAVLLTLVMSSSAFGQTYTISTVAGNGTYGFSGDNGPATSAQLGLPVGIAVDSVGSLYIAELFNNRVRKVSNGVITTVAGNGTVGFSGDNGPATSAQLNGPSGVAVDSVGGLYIADSGNSRIRKVSNGVITTVAGNGTVGFSGDYGSATSAQLGGFYGIASIAVDSFGSLYIADEGNNRIRKVSNGVIATVAGNGSGNFSGDNGPATSAQLCHPGGVAVDSAGDFYIATINSNDCTGDRIRKVSNGVITTVAGNGTSGFSGDNGPATGAELQDPQGIAVDSTGNLYIVDGYNFRIRKVSNGVITTVAGNGTRGFSGDNGPATSAELDFPCCVAVDSVGKIYIAEASNNRVRVLTPAVPCSYSVSPTTFQAPASGGSFTVNIQTGASCSWIISGLPAWMSVSGASSGTGSGSVTLVAAPNSGTALSATILIAGVSVTVTQAVAMVTASPTSLSFTYQAGGNTPSSAPIAVTGSASGLRFSATASTLSGGNWLSVSPSSGDTPGSVTVGVNPSGLTANTYTGTVVVTGASGATGSTTIDVTLTVTLRLPTIAVSPTSVSFAYTAGGSNPNSQTITVSGTGTFIAQASSNGNWLAVTPGSGTAPASLTVSANPAGFSAGTYSGAISLTATGSSTGSTAVTVSLTVTAPLPTIAAVVNAASYATGAVSPGELVTIFGTNIGPAAAASATTDSSTGKLATTIGGVQVLFNGTAAPMIYASSTQVSAVVPYEMASVANPSVWIKYAGQTSNAYQLTTVTTAPGLFTQNASGSGPGAILNQDNSVNGPGNRAAKGSIVQVFMTGEGQTSPPSVTGAITTATLPPPQVTPAPLLAVGVTINGQPALYVYAGEAPGLVAGMMQLNVQIPANAPSGELPILVSVGGNTSQKGVTVSVQ